MDFGVVAVLHPCFGFLSFGYCSGAPNGWSLVYSIFGMRVFFRLDPRGVGRWILPLGGLWLLGFRGWSTGVHCLQGDGDLWGFFWLLVDLKKDKTGLHFLGFWGGSGFSFPWGSGWVALLSCGHGDGALFILGFGMVLEWWGSGVWSRSSGDLGIW